MTSRVDQLIHTIQEGRSDLETASSLLGDRIALFSIDRKYRYILSVTWDASRPYCCFCMLNPSVADHEISDATVTRCGIRAKEWCYGGLVVLNIFAYRSTDPKALYLCKDPVGPWNDETILLITMKAGMVILGYGRHGKLLGRGEKVLSLLREHKVSPHALRINLDKSPGHPLYINYDARPVLME